MGDIVENEVITSNMKQIVNKIFKGEWNFSGMC